MAEYRQWRPLWVADHGERGLANWISDRCWAHLLSLADAVPDMTVIEKGVWREISIGVNYRFRVKRHDFDGNISSYETASFLDFVEQPEGQLDGTEEIRLVAGYEWLKDTHEIGDAVISMRNGKDNVIWKEHLPVFPEEGVAGISVVAPEPPTPQLPTIGLPERIGREERDATDRE